jgi:hypothetical protein
MTDDGQRDTNAGAAELAVLRGMIGHVIAALGGGADRQQVSRNSWTIRRGSAEGMIMLLEDAQSPGDSAVVVSFPIMRIPAAGTARLCRHLLELNRSMMGRAAFSMGEETVILLSSRPAAGLDGQELTEFVGWTARLADHYDDVLLEQYGYDNRLSG